jgi:Ca2+-binding EF-hand superfamily protein
MKNIALSALSIVALLASTAAFAADAPTTPPKGPEHHGAKMFEENDSNKDGAISKDEWQAKGDKMFGEIDANKDGKISQDEMKAHHDLKRAEWQKRKVEAGEKLGDHKDVKATPAAKPETSKH